MKIFIFKGLIRTTRSNFWINYTKIIDDKKKMMYLIKHHEFAKNDEKLTLWLLTSLEDKLVNILNNSI